MGSVKTYARELLIVHVFPDFTTVLVGRSGSQQGKYWFLLYYHPVAVSKVNTSTVLAVFQYDPPY